MCTYAYLCVLHNVVGHINECHILAHACTATSLLCLQVESFVSDYLVEQVIFEEVLDLCSEGQPATLLTREAITECTVDGETVIREGRGGTWTGCGRSSVVIDCTVV